MKYQARLRAREREAIAKHGAESPEARAIREEIRQANAQQKQGTILAPALTVSATGGSVPFRFKRDEWEPRAKRRKAEGFSPAEVEIERANWEQDFLLNRQGEVMEQSNPHAPDAEGSAPSEVSLESLIGLDPMSADKAAAIAKELQRRRTPGKKLSADAQGWLTRNRVEVLEFLGLDRNATERGVRNALSTRLQISLSSSTIQKILLSRSNI